MTISATCLAIAVADKNGTLSFSMRKDRFGDMFVAIIDEHGTIEIASDLDHAHDRVAAVRARAS